MTPHDLLALYDTHVRGSFATRLPAGWVPEQDGPLTRCRTPRGGFAMLTDDANGLSPDQLAALVDRTFAFYRAEDRDFEWKTFDHDRADLVPLLVAHGAVPEPHEALVLGEAEPLARPVPLPDGLVLREVSSRADLERVAAMESTVWGEDWSWLADDLEERRMGPERAVVCVVEDPDAAGQEGGDRTGAPTVVSAAWLVPLEGTPVAGLWGGSTLPAYRGRGIYRALVAHRARLALDLGYRILQVDASDDSRPILTRLGLHVVGGTTPYVTAPGAVV